MPFDLVQVPLDLTASYSSIFYLPYPLSPDTHARIYVEMTTFTDFIRENTPRMKMSARACCLKVTKIAPVHSNILHCVYFYLTSVPEA